MINMSLGLGDAYTLLYGTLTTLALTFWAVAGGTILGVLLGIVRAEASWWVSGLVGTVLDIFKSVPLLIQFVLLNALLTILQIRISMFAVACIALAIYAASFCTEVVRAGILAVPQNTRRAGRSLGMTYRQDLLYIVFPLALRVALPGWIGLALSVMKDTSLVLWLGIIELLRASQNIVIRTQEPLLVLAIAGMIYFAISFPLSRLGRVLERSFGEKAQLR